MKRLAYIIMLLSLPIVAISQQPPQKPILEQTTITETERKIIALEEQNKVLRDFSSSTLSTVYWSLGSVFTLVALMAGIGWWSNFKSYEQDKSRLKNELANLISINEATTTIRLEEFKSTIERIFDSKLDTRIQQLHNDILEIRSSITSDRSAIENKFIDNVSKIDTLKNETNELQKGISLVEAELRAAEEHIWDIKKIPSNILLTQAMGLSAAIDANSNNDIKRFLERMKHTITMSYLSVDKKIEKKIAELISPGFERVPKEYLKMANEIRELLEKITKNDGDADDQKV